MQSMVLTGMRLATKVVPIALSMWRDFMRTPSSVSPVKTTTATDNVNDFTVLEKETEAKARVDEMNMSGSGSSVDATTTTPRKNAPPRKSVPAPLRRRVWHDSDKKCVLCHAGLDYDTFHVAHIQAHALGGQLELANLTVLCAPCNLAVGTQNVAEYKIRHGL